ncbi:hypothetical protein [Mycobacterium kubicae]|uniref:hypothetical protein n=1 Tax=Mycobacterium kubicae TaxID=120959 RepID=UPI000A5578C3|nr:hypothetical protein [Mycobacterium kubicae]
MVHRAGVAIAVGVVAACALAGCGGSGGKTAAPTMTVRSSSGTQLPPIYPGTTVPPLPSSTPTSAPTSALPSTSPTTSARSFPGDGVYRMGQDIQAGTYQAQGSSSCSWERLRGFRGTSTDVIEHGEGAEPQVVRIEPSDAGFKTQHCGTWTLQSAGAVPSTAPVSLPPGAQACPPTSGTPGSLGNSAVGSPDTTCPFAEQVRLAYVFTGPASPTPRQIEAVSPVTGQHYSMTCASDGSLVVCRGGNGAVVYVY